MEARVKKEMKIVLAVVGAIVVPAAVNFEPMVSLQFAEVSGYSLAHTMIEYLGVSERELLESWMGRVRSP